MFLEILPLVEFVLEDGITDEEAVKLIETPPSYGSESKDNKENGWIQTEGESYQMLHFEENSSTVDPFTAKLVNFDVNFFLGGDFISKGGSGGVERITIRILLQIEKDGFTPVTVNRSTLKSLDPNEVLISQRPKPLRYRYYRNIIPDLPIVICHSCHKVMIKKQKIFPKRTNENEENDFFNIILRLFTWTTTNFKSYKKVTVHFAELQVWILL